MGFAVMSLPLPCAPRAALDAGPAGVAMLIAAADNAYAPDDHDRVGGTFQQAAPWQHTAVDVRRPAVGLS